RLDRRGRADCVCDGRRPPAAAARRLRRLSGEADRRQGVSRPGSYLAAIDPSADEPMSSSGKLLVVDDPPQNIQLLDAVFSPRGYAVLSASSGKDALTKATTEGPDLVLLDVLMPEMDGYEVCRRLREEPSTRLLPVIMVTASGRHEKVRALEAG